MARIRILLDSNAYFRLARNIRPLLDEEFGGESRYCLYVIKEFADEFARSARLRRKFGWVDGPEYVANRSRPLQLSKSERKDVESTRAFIEQYARAEGLGTSAVDMKALAIAYVLQIQIVTDDQDMLSLADAFEISRLNTLGLMRLMFDHGHIDMDRVRQIAGYWQFEKDTPARFHEDFERLFGEKPPPPI